jgi:hypothetical protein
MLMEPSEPIPMVANVFMMTSFCAGACRLQTPGLT